jgi:hypothetical protein
LLQHDLVVSLLLLWVLGLVCWCCCHVQEHWACLVHGRVAEVQPGKSFLQTLSGQLGLLWQIWQQPQPGWHLQSQQQKLCGCRLVAGWCQVLMLPVLHWLLQLVLVLTRVLVLLVAGWTAAFDHAGMLVHPVQHFPWHTHLLPALLHQILLAGPDSLAAVPIVGFGSPRPFLQALRLAAVCQTCEDL